jgi:alcohol dehydrogenase (NADP+)
MLTWPLQITHCGICGSDLHTLRSGWGETLYPCCVGHEIVGKAVRVGSKVEGGIKVGDRVGVGAQSSSCLKPECAECADNNEQHCQNGMVGTYNSKYPGDIGKSYGGYADYWRGPSHFVIKIPDELSSEEVAPMLCGGITSCSPLMRNGAGPGKKVGIVGIGGLGHYGLLFAKALGCEKVVAISRTSAKREDALKMGATDFIATDEDEDWATKHAGSLDLIISTVSSPKMPLMGYLTLLGVGGQFIQVGAPEDSIPPFNAFALIAKEVKIGGSMIGSPEEIRQMLKLAVEKGVHSWTNKYSMKDANKALVDFNEGKPRYRIVLVNEKHA